MSLKANKENQGFKLLEEDCLDDRPCAAVKKFVASVLDKKDLKDQDVAASFRNLMEYREAPPSPTMGSHSAMDRDGLGSPTTPSSPPPMGATSSGHTERLPNELLDEICEDIGMKSGEMELDFVEFLMEQDMDPQAYMTPEAILNSGGSLPSGAGSSSGGSNGGGSISAASSNISTPSNSSASGCGFTPIASSMGNAGNSSNGRQNMDQDWPHHMPSPVVSGAPGTTTALSSGSNSPATKRIHLSTSESSSPNKDPGQPPLPSQPSGSTSLPAPSQSPRGAGQVFKMPQTPPTPRRSMSCPQGAPSSGGGGTVNGSASGSNSSLANCQGLPSKSGRLSPRPFSSQNQFTKDGHEAAGHSQPNSNSGGGVSNFLFKNSEPMPRTQCYSPKPVQFSSCDHARRSSEGSMQIASCQQQPAGIPQYHSMHQHQHAHQHMPGKDCGFQKPEKLAPPNINVKNFMQFRWGSQSSPAHPHHPASMGKSPYGYHMQTPHQHPPGVARMDSPLDQGYFSNESAGNGTSSSAPSPALTTSSMSSMSSLSSMTSLSTMMPADPKASGQPSMAARQKSVHFADLPDGSPPDALSQGQSASAMDIQGYGRFTSNQSPSECAFDMDSAQQKSMQSKILPRLNHHVMKPGVAPYTVPNAAGVVPASTVGNYDFNNRSCCALNQQNRTSPADVAGGGGAGSMQPFDFASSGSDGKSGGGDGMYFVDSNQNMMRMDSSPGMDYPAHASAYGNCNGGYNLPVNQMRGVHQQQQGGPMPPHMMQMQQQQHHAHQQQPPQAEASSQGYNSCSLPMMQRMPCASPGYSSQQGLSMQMNGGMGMSLGSSMNIQQQGMGGSATHDGMGTIGPPPAHGFQPQSMSTPCMPRGSVQPAVRSGMQGPSYSQMSSGYDYSMGDRQPNSIDVQMFSNQQQQHVQGIMPPQTSGACGPGWPGPGPGPAPTPGMQDMAGSQHPGLGQHPGQMKPPHPMAAHHHHHHHPQQQAPSHHMQAMVMGQQQQQQQQGPPHPGPCAGNPTCAGCKVQAANRQGPASKAFSSQQKFIQNLIMDESNSAYRSHPLYPLLRDLVIAGMNFDDPKFHYQQLLSLLPHDFEKLLQNFLHRNPPTGNYQSNYSVESVLMDSLRLAHSYLVEKIRARQEQEKVKALTSTSIRSMEEFCEKFDHAQMVGIQGQPAGMNGCSPLLMAGGGQMGDMGMPAPLHIMTTMGPPTKVMVSLGQGSFVSPGMAGAVAFRPMKDGQDMLGDGGGVVGSTGQKTESKKHPSLPKEAVSLMMEWLRGHKDNPYPNDDEKAMLIKQTGLTINQINYWFTNARRRILPKWAQCK